LAGFDVVGCNEIDPKVFRVYERNHHPRHPYVCSIRDMLEMELPGALVDLDILDGSPPCTSFSSNGLRDKTWGQKKKFSEGQVLQRLDDLFFDFIALAERLRPRVVVAENVSGLIAGNSRGYVKEITAKFRAIGYRVQLFDLNAARMGVPQARRRVFFLAARGDLQLPRIRLDFNEPSITFRQVEAMVGPQEAERSLTPQQLRKYRSSTHGYAASAKWVRCSVAVSLGKSRRELLYRWNDRYKLSYSQPCRSLVGMDTLFHPAQARWLTLAEWSACGTFPTDMDWGDWGPKRAKWAIGMSVPPYMVQRIALEIRHQWGQALRGGSP